jgi:hypothetical protein
MFCELLALLELVSIMFYFESSLHPQHKIYLPVTNNYNHMSPQSTYLPTHGPGPGAHPVPYPMNTVGKVAGV